MLKEGKKRIDQALEIDKVIKLQFKLQSIVKVLFSKTEQFLLNNQRKFVLLKSNSDTSDSNTPK